MPTSADLLHHEISGTLDGRRPVLLLRPIAGTIALWGELRERLAEHRPVIACEARGIGRSPPARARTSTRSMAADAARLVEALGIDTVHVFGLSLGGMVATRLAAEFSGLVSSLVLGSTPLTGRSLARDPLHNRAFATCLVKGRGSREACLTEHALSERFKREQPARTAAILDDVRREGGSLRTLAIHSLAGALHDARDAAPTIRARTRCIAGELDEIVGLDRARELAARIPAAELTVMPGVGHDLSLEAPAELARLIAEHCDRSEPGVA